MGSKENNDNITQRMLIGSKNNKDNITQRMLMTSRKQLDKKDVKFEHRIQSSGWNNEIRQWSIFEPGCVDGVVDPMQIICPAFKTKLTYNAKNTVVIDFLTLKVYGSYLTGMG